MAIAVTILARWSIRIETSMSRLKTLMAPGLALALTCGAGSALADLGSISYDLTQGNTSSTAPSLSSLPGPYAKVTVDLLDKTHATFTFTGLSDAKYSYLLGATGSVGANVSGSFQLVSGSISGSNPFAGFSRGSYSNGGAGNEGGFGSFDLTINSTGGYTNSAQTISFEIQATGGNSWSTASAVTTANNQSQFLAAHMFAALNPVTVGEGATVTGFASGALIVPEPSTWLIAVVGAIGFVGYGLSRRTG
jgi:hypothetical protein